MRVLLDANIPRKFKHHLTELDVATAREMGWNNFPDGQLLATLEGQFDVLVTMDKSLRFEQRLDNRGFAVIVLRAKSNKLADLVHLVPDLLALVLRVHPGELHEIKTAT